MQQLLHPESQVVVPSSLHLSPSLKRGLTIGHSFSMKEMEWGRTIGVRGGSTVHNMSDHLSRPRRTVGRTYLLYRQNTTLNTLINH